MTVDQFWGNQPSSPAGIVPDDLFFRAMRIVFDKPDGPHYFVVAPHVARALRKANARLDAMDRFTGRNWRRIKREGRKAWERTT